MSVLIKLAIVSVLYGIVFAAEKPCCLGEKFTGKMRSTTAYLQNGSLVPVVADSTFIIDYDKDMRMERLKGSVYTLTGSVETTTNYTVYNDFGNMKKYIILGTGRCQVSANPVQTAPCVPSTLQHMGTVEIGSGNAGWQVNAWDGMFENFHYSYLTTIDDCTPVTLARFGTDEHGTRLSESIVYSDFIQNSTTPDAFHLPDDCIHGGMAVGK